MSAYERRRGANFEREVASQLRAALPGAVVVRGQQGRGGCDAPDVAVDAANGSHWLGIECKRGPVGRVPLLPALRQSVRDCEGTGRVPLAVVREDRAEAWALLTVDDWRSLRDAANAERCGVNAWEERLSASRVRESFCAKCCDTRYPDFVQVGIVVGAPDKGRPHAALLLWSDLLGRVLAPLWKATRAGKEAA